MSNREKTPKTKVAPDPSKQAKSKEPISEESLAWRFSHGDKGGPFSWAATLTKIEEVVTRLSEFESMTWNQILETGSHPIEVSRLSDQAKRRLVEIQKDDVDELMSFRVSGSGRVWCIKSEKIMRILWWDADHQVYPTPVDKADRKKLRNRN